MTNTWERAAVGLRAAADELDYGEVTVGALLNRGFDVVGGNLEYNGIPVAPSFIAPAGGPVPAGLEQDVQRERARLSTTYEKAWLKHFALSLAPGAMGGSESAFGRLSHTERAALSEGTDAQGGAAVPPTIASQILSRMTALSVIRARATIVPTVTDQLRLPAFKANATAASTYSTDWVGGWHPEYPAADTADPSFELFEVAVRKARSGTLRISRDLAQDAPAALGWLVDVGSRDLALVTDGGFVAGTGLSLQPRGILESGVAEVDVEGSTANTISSTTANAGSGPKIAALAEAIPAQYRRNAVMLASTTGEANLMKLVDGAGTRLYKRGERVEGMRVDISPHLEADGVDGNCPIVAGDLGAYVVAQRSLEIVVMRERFADVDQLGVVIRERVGGGLWDTQALRLGVV